MNKTKKDKSKKFSWMKIIGVCFTVSIIAGLLGGALTNEYVIAYFFGKFIQEQEEKLPIVKRVIEEHTFVEESLTTDATKKVTPSVVALFASEADAGNVEGQFNETTSDRFYLGVSGGNQYNPGTIQGGTGFFISTDGLIATCASNVSGKKTWYAATEDEEIYTATVVYQDPYDNIAFLKVDSEGLTQYVQTLTFAPNPLSLGQKVLAFGMDPQINAHVKSGIIAHNIYDENESDKERVKALSFPSEFIHIDFEIDSSLNCGPLVNLGGELVGMSLDFDSVENGTTYVLPAEVLQDAFIQALQ